jgi:hypothetical protein
VRRSTAYRSGITLVVALIAATVPSLAMAAPITVYQAPAGVYQDTASNPCVFYGPGVCPNDPAAWPDPAGPTNGDFDTLTRSYVGGDFDEWLNVVGSSFVLGLHIRDSQGTQTLDPFTISFFDAASNPLGSYTLLSPVAVPTTGIDGFADYILAAGCGGAVSDTGAGPDACSSYLPFVLPDGTASLQMTFGFATGNNGPDKVFAVPYEASVPEPASLVLLGIGFIALSRRALKGRKAQA